MVSLATNGYDRCDHFIGPVNSGLPPTVRIVSYCIVHQFHLKQMRYSMLLQSRFNDTYNERQVCLIEYLKNRIRSGRCFLKSKYIARELGLSSKEVGTNMAILAETCPDFSIEKYSYSNSTTWLVTPVHH